MHRKVLLPSLFTFLNFFWGVFSIVKIIEGNLHAAAWFIILAILCDGMDGKLARWTGSESPFGFELDSLADLVSSGLAPALLAYRGGLFQIKFIGVIICFLYVFAGGYRLARFNVVQRGDRTRGYVGLPIPIAGITIASFWIFKMTTGLNAIVVSLVALMVVFTILMVSTVHYDWPKLIFRAGWRHTIQSVGILLAVSIMAIFPQWSLFPLFLFYILLGVTHWIIVVYTGRSSLREFFLSVSRE